MTTAVRKSIPTSAQILKEQQERADREREARLAAGRKMVAPQPAAKQPQDEIERLTGQVVAPAKATSVAVPDTRTPQQAYLDEIAPPSSLVGRPIKFDGKAGKWLFGDTDEEISPDTDFIPLCDEVLIGWIKFNGKGEQPDRIQGLLYDGFVMPPLSSLPDRDQSKWELGLDRTRGSMATSNVPDLAVTGNPRARHIRYQLAHRTVSCRQPAAALRSHAQERRRSLPRRPAQGLRLQPSRRAGRLGAHAGLCRRRQGLQGIRRHPRHVT
jgi:hypothetical protein